MTGYGRAFALLRDAAAEPWHAYTRHEFVAGLADGTLPRAAFLHYLRQDYVFLIHFSRAWALGVVKSTAHDEMMLASATVNTLVNEEMQLHVGICAEAGISQEELFATAERPENLAYTRYVLEAGYSGDLADLLAALMPCVLGYGEIGARLGQEATSETYRDWIDTYASEGFQTACREAGKMLDLVLERRLGADFQASPRWSRICRTFETATRLECDFWQMGLTP